MSRMVATLQSWLAAAERLTERLPDLAELVGAGGWPVGVLAMAVGLALLAAGARLGRILTAAGGALVGFWVFGLLGSAFPAWVPAVVPGLVGAGVLGFSSFMSPIVYPVVLGLVPGVLLGMHVAVAGKAWLGGVAGGVVLALAGAVLRRVVVAATAAVAGAALVAGGLLSLAVKVPALDFFARRQVILLVVAAVLAVAGTAFQLGAGAERAGRPKNRIEPGEPRPLDP